MPASEKPFSIVVLISGGGTTLRNFVEKISAGQLPVEIGLVVASSPAAKGLRFAHEAGIPSVVVERKAFASQDDFSAAIFEHCRRVRADLVVMAGFLKRITIPEDFANRVVNIHPALVPAFCGEGFYGHHVHESVLEYGAKLSGCTVHFADNQYDHGPVIVQRAVPVLDDDTPDTLAARVFEAECEAYPEALRLIAAGRVTVEGRRVRIRPNIDSIALFSIRREQPGDVAAVREVNLHAFGQPQEANVVDKIRANCSDLISLVAVVENRVMGHVLFSPVIVEGKDIAPRGMGLAPVAVLPEFQRQGIGSALIRAGIAELAARQCPYVVVLGHASYYPRFGFEQASRYGIRCEWEVPNEAFMILVLDKSRIQEMSGLVKYRSEFAETV